MSSGVPRAVDGGADEEALLLWDLSGMESWTSADVIAFYANLMRFIEAEKIVTNSAKVHAKAVTPNTYAFLDVLRKIGLEVCLCDLNTNKMRDQFASLVATAAEGLKVFLFVSSSPDFAQIVRTLKGNNKQVFLFHGFNPDSEELYIETLYCTRSVRISDIYTPKTAQQQAGAQSDARRQQEPNVALPVEGAMKDSDEDLPQEAQRYNVTEHDSTTEPTDVRQERREQEKGGVVVDCKIDKNSLRYGFIQPNDGSERVFIHERNAQCPLKDGIRVTFRSVPNPKMPGKLMAVDVRSNEFKAPEPSLLATSGRVISWMTDRFGQLYGFIEPDIGGENIFLHSSSVMSGTVSQGCYVTFKTAKSARKPNQLSAIEVHVVSPRRMPMASTLPSYGVVGSANIRKQPTDMRRAPPAMGAIFPTRNAPPALGEGAAMAGTVISWQQDKRGKFYGYIVPDDYPQEHIFLHSANVVEGEARQGSRVVFTTQSDGIRDGKLQAVLARVLSGSIPPEQLPGSLPQLGRGRLINWVLDKTSKYCGFIAPDDGSENVYMHSSEITSGKEIAGVGAGIEYRIRVNQRNQRCAYDARVFAAGRVESAEVLPFCVGKIVSWQLDSNGRYYGYIAPDNDDTTLFFHSSQVRCGNPSVGARVRYTVVASKNKVGMLEAVNVEVA